MNLLVGRAIVLVGTLLAACHAKEPKKPSDPKAVLACMEGQNGHDDYVLTTKCEPLGPQQKLQGTWFVGLELSDFRNGYMGVPAEFGTTTGNEYQLVVPAALDEKPHAKDREGPLAYQVTFLGRESAIPYMPGLRLMVADKVLSLRPVPISHVARPQS